MRKDIGKVIDVFIPKEYRAGRLVDVMDVNKIGFKVRLKDEIVEVIEEQDEYNTDIMMGDIVLITRQNISGKDFIDIELYDGDVYE